MVTVRLALPLTAIIPTPLSDGYSQCFFFLFLQAMLNEKIYMGIPQGFSSHGKYAYSSDPYMA